VELGANQGVWRTESPRSWSIFKYTTWNLRPCDNERHNDAIDGVYCCSAHRARGYFRYVQTVVCKYHLRFLGPYTIITNSSLFIVPGRTELILLSWFIDCWECFICQFSSGYMGRSPGRESGGLHPPEAAAFLKYTAWNLRPGENERHTLMPLIAFYCCAHQHCVVSVSCCTMFGILGTWFPFPLKSTLGTKSVVYSR